MTNRSIKLALAAALLSPLSPVAHADAVGEFQGGTTVMVRMGHAAIGSGQRTLVNTSISKAAGTLDFVVTAGDLGLPVSATVHMHGSSASGSRIVYTINETYSPPVSLGNGHTLSKVAGTVTAIASRIPGTITPQIGDVKLTFDGSSQVVATGDWGTQTILLGTTELIGGIPQPALGALVDTGDTLVCSDSVATTHPLAVWIDDLAQGTGAGVDFKAPPQAVRLPATVVVQAGHRQQTVAAVIPANVTGTVHVTAASSGVTRALDLVIHPHKDCAAPPGSSPAIESWLASSVAGCTSCTGYVDINKFAERLATIDGETAVVAGTDVVKLVEAFPNATAIGADTMNNDGSFAGRATFSGVTQAYRANLNHGKTMVQLGAMTPEALNNYNLVVGFRLVNNVSQAVYSNGNGIVQYALSSGYGVAASRALGVNDDGRAIGTYTDSSGVVRGFTIFDGSTTTLPVVGAKPAIPIAINNAGQIAANGLTSAGLPVAAIVTPSGGVTTIAPPPGFASFVLTSINRYGSVAGVATMSNGVQRAFAWSPSGGFTSLTGHVAGLTATTALRITDANRVVVNGTYNGVTDLFIVTL